MAKTCSICKQAVGHNSRSCPFRGEPPNGTPVLCADWERDGAWRVVRWDSDGISEERIEKYDMLNGKLWRNEASIVIVEAAHLQPRSTPPTSVSQVFHTKELMKLQKAADKSGAVFLAFPQRLSRWARLLSAYGDDKELDPYAIIEFHAKLPIGNRVDVKKWEPRRDMDKALNILAENIRNEMTRRLNVLRAVEYNTDGWDQDEVGNMFKVLQKIIDKPPQSLSDEKFRAEVFDYMHLNPKIDWKNKLRGSRNLIRLMSLYVCVFERDGSIRKNNDIYDPSDGDCIILKGNGREIGVKFIWDRLLLMSPYSGQSGTARANLMYYGLGNYDRTNIPDNLSLLVACESKGCNAKIGQPCKTKSGASHATRKKLRYPEPKELREKRQENRKKWRKMQKAMLRAMISVGTEAN